MIHINLKNFLTGTLILFMGVPFCFSQHLLLRTVSGAELQPNPFLPRNDVRSKLQQESRNLTFRKTDQSVFSSTPSFISPLLRGRPSRGLYSAQDTLKSDTAIRRPVFKKFRMKKSPWLAVGLSAILPGAGQFYNQSYWKVPILLGIAGYLGYEYVNNDKKYRDYRDQYAASQTPENLYTGDENLKKAREFYRNQRNDFVWYFAILYVVNLIDAYVDAHLFDFNVKEDKLTRFGLTDREYKLNVKVRF